MVKENLLMRRSASTLSMSQPENVIPPTQPGSDPDARLDVTAEPAAPLSGSSAHADADLTALIVAGKAQGYLTFDQVNSYLPDEAVDPEKIDCLLVALEEQGIELVDTDRCIGCGYCVQACPYGIRFMNHDTGVADKCNWCYHRVMRNEQPACVEACPTGARVFGRIDDPDSEISKRLATLPTGVLRQHLGTIPLTRYVGLTDEVT